MLYLDLTSTLKVSIIKGTFLEELFSPPFLMKGEENKAHPTRESTP